MAATDELDEGYERLHRTGPEFDGWLSNHGPMVVEALVRRDRGDAVGSWLDGYLPKLDALPPLSGTARWPDDLGDVRLLGAWVQDFTDQLREAPWRDVLTTWWPRLLPGVAAGATHGAIRVGHAVNALLTWGEDDRRIAELAQALGYWAARWQPVPLATAPAGTLTVADALAAMPRIGRQDGGISDRLAQLPHLDHWQSAQRSLDAAGDAEGALRRIVTAAVRRYATHAHGSPVMLVHAATAPNALRRALPAIPAELHGATVAAGWSASAAIFAAYAPAEAIAPVAGMSGDDPMDLAAAHGDEHAIKLTDTAMDVLGWTGDERALQAAQVALTRIAPGAV